VNHILNIEVSCTSIVPKHVLCFKRIKSMLYPPLNLIQDTQLKGSGTSRRQALPFSLRRWAGQFFIVWNEPHCCIYPEVSGTYSRLAFVSHLSHLSGVPGDAQVHLHCFSEDLAPSSNACYRNIKPHSMIQPQKESSSQTEQREDSHCTSVMGTVEICLVISHR